MDLQPKPSDEATGVFDASLAPAESVKAEDLDNNGGSTAAECWRKMFWFLTIWTRLVALAFCFFAFWGCWEIQRLMVGGGATNAFEIDENVLRVPLVLCLPTAFVIDGVVYTTREAVDQNNVVDANCRSLDYMIYSAALSLLLSSIAVFLFLIADTVGRWGGHVDRTRSVGTGTPYRRMASKTVAGMGILLLFQLVQTGIASGALVEQLNAWVEYVNDIIQRAPTAVQGNNEDGDDFHNPAADIDYVESLANIWVLLTSSILAFVAAFWVIVDALIVYPCRPLSEVEDTHVYASTR